jgi:hypothetical protein
VKRDTPDALEQQETHRLLRELIAEVRGLPERIAAAVQFATQAQIDVRDPERAALRSLLSEISASVGDRVFSAQELIAHAHVDRALRGALETAFGEFQTCTPRRLGKRLLRAVELGLSEYRVERITAERAGIVWRIVVAQRVSNLQNSQATC